MSQIPLINTKWMSTTKAHAKLARERASSLNATDIQSSVPIAAAPVATSTRLPARSQENAEFNMPDEDRDIPLMSYRCPDCGGPMQLLRRNRGTQWKAACSRAGIEIENDRPFFTAPPSPWQSTSQQAVAHWKMVCALTKDL